MSSRDEPPIDVRHADAFDAQCEEGAAKSDYDPIPSDEPRLFDQLDLLDTVNGDVLSEVARQEAYDRSEGGESGHVYPIPSTRYERVIGLAASHTRLAMQLKMGIARG